ILLYIQQLPWWSIYVTYGPIWIESYVCSGLGYIMGIFESWIYFRRIHYFKKRIRKKSSHNTLCRQYSRMDCMHLLPYSTLNHSPCYWVLNLDNIGTFC